MCIRDRARFAASLAADGARAAGDGLFKFGSLSLGQSVEAMVKA